jgi:hypothetical protein
MALAERLWFSKNRLRRNTALKTVVRGTALSGCVRGDYLRGA